MRPRNFESVVERLNRSPDLSHYNCADVPLIQSIEHKRQRVVESKLIARDPDVPATWAIVDLDWDFPPYLLPVDGRVDGDTVRMDVGSGRDGLTVRVDYRYFQQDGSPEKGTLIRYYAAGADGRWCMIGRSGPGSGFMLPADFRANLRASVTPRSATKSGQERFGTPRMIGDGQGAPCVGR
jgi:hypothetical protein